LARVASLSAQHACGGDIGFELTVPCGTELDESQPLEN